MEAKLPPWELHEERTSCAYRNPNILSNAAMISLASPNPALKAVWQVVHIGIGSNRLKYNARLRHRV